MNEIRRICHRIVFNAFIDQEWQRHQSAFASLWRVEMQSRGKVLDLTQRTFHEILSAIQGADLSVAVQSALEKDAPLVAAALATDRIIISLDDKARDGFINCRSVLKSLDKLRWFNPASDFDELRAWLAAGK